MFTMKPTTAARIMAFAGPLVLTSASAFGQTRPRSRDANDDRFANQLLDNVVEMTRAEFPEATIIAYARVRRARLKRTSRPPTSSGSIEPASAIASSRTSRA